MLEGKERSAAVPVGGSLAAGEGPDEPGTESYGPAAGLVERVRAAVRDPERLAAVQRTGLLETPGGERFDRLTEFASESLRAPVAMLTLIGKERQRRISAVTPVDWQERRWDPVEDALDVVPLALREAVVVEDAGSHPLLRHSAFVRTWGVVAYAAVPLRLESGVTVGAMSVADLEPRSWGHREIELLRILARTASIELELVLAAAREKRLRGLVAEARAEAESAKRASGDFLSLMSHEFRTPLNSILGYTEMIERARSGAMTDRQKELLERIGDQGRGLLDLVNDVFRLSRIEAGLVTSARGEVDVGAVLQSVGKKLRGRRGDRGVVLRLDLPDRATPLMTDREQLFQVLTALVGRAMTAPEKGQVLVRLLADPDTGEPREVHIIDTGPGIPADRLPTLFRPFEMTPSGGTRSEGATGLALPIARALAELLGFRIRVTSQVGVGTTFILEFSAEE